jgi:hypothetical protein
MLGAEEHMKTRATKQSHKRARPVSLRIKTAVRAGGDVIMPNHNETLVSYRPMRTLMM